MGFPVSPVIADLAMEDFEQRALENAPNPPSMWLGYFDDTFTVLWAYFIDEFSDHLNSIDPHIQFTTSKVYRKNLHTWTNTSTWVPITMWNTGGQS